MTGKSEDLGVDREDARLLPRLSTASSTAPVTSAEATGFDDDAPMPPVYLNFYFNGDTETHPLDSATEKLFDALGITKRRHLRARIRYLIEERLEEAASNWDNS